MWPPVAAPVARTTARLRSAGDEPPQEGLERPRRPPRLDRAREQVERDPRAQRQRRHGGRAEPPNSPAPYAQNASDSTATRRCTRQAHPAAGLKRRGLLARARATRRASTRSPRSASAPRRIRARRPQVSRTSQPPTCAPGPDHEPRRRAAERQPRPRPQRRPARHSDAWSPDSRAARRRPRDQTIANIARTPRPLRRKTADAAVGQKARRAVVASTEPPCCIARSNAQAGGERLRSLSDPPGKASTASDRDKSRSSHAAPARRTRAVPPDRPAPASRQRQPQHARRAAGCRRRTAALRGRCRAGPDRAADA